MIEDRDYMRQPDYGGSRWPGRFGVQWSVTICFLIAYTVVFFVGLAFPQSARFSLTYFALSNEGLAHGYVWQLVSYQFMHAGFLHLFFNGWAIYVFGLALEYEIGRLRFAALMLSSGIVGGVLQTLLTWLAPHLFPDSPVVGASACAFGLVAAFAMLHPGRELTMLIFFIIPVTVEARVLLWVSAGLAVGGMVLGIFFNTGNIANGAHLGGMAMGWFFVRMIMHGDWPKLSGALPPAERNQPRRPKLEPLEPKADTDFLERQVDPILDKISAHGIASLTAREREILEAARKKMTRS